MALARPIAICSLPESSKQQVQQVMEQRAFGVAIGFVMVWFGVDVPTQAAFQL